jgi:hypothetical protein
LPYWYSFLYNFVKLAFIGYYLAGEFEMGECPNLTRDFTYAVAETGECMRLLFSGRNHGKNIKPGYLQKFRIAACFAIALHWLQFSRKFSKPAFVVIEV